MFFSFFLHAFSLSLSLSLCHYFSLFKKKKNIMKENHYGPKRRSP